MLITRQVNVRLGSFATGLSHQQVRPCPLCSESEVNSEHQIRMVWLKSTAPDGLSAYEQDPGDLPVGQISSLPVQPRFEKFSRAAPLDAPPKSEIFSRASRPTRGAYRDRHGRRVRDAVDASGAADESAGSRTVKSCGPDAPTLASSLRN